MKMVILGKSVLMGMTMIAMAIKIAQTIGVKECKIQIQELFVAKAIMIVRSTIQPII
jgi:hypothetical protein